MKSFTRGVWIGKYPDELCSGIYAVSANKPASQSALEFLKWINSGGQQLLSQNGYAAISSVEKSANLEAMIDKPELVDQTSKPLISRTWLMVILAFAAAVLILIGAVRYTRKQKTEDLSNEIDITPAFNEDSILAPKGIYFDKTHTWAFMEQNGFVKVGIDDFLQHITGTITRIRMKEPGEKVRRGEKIVTVIRNGKQMEIYSPVSGVIREQNQSLLADASMLNKSPYSEGWVYLIEPKNWLKEMQFLFMAGKYKSWLQDEFTRLKDFLAASMKSNTTVYAHVILQDGGELTDHVLAELGPEVWEDFQTNFIDTSK
jgi:glycine cleavage system H lipoate-binding protein